MRNTKSAAVAAVLLAAAMTASACSSSKSGSTGNTPGKSIPKASVNDINPKDPSTLKGGTLTLAVSQYSTQWNVNTNDGNEADTATVMSALMPTAFHFDAGGTPTIDKDYLLDASVTSAAPNMVVTYKLNPAAKWSDGTAISAADYIATWKALNGTNTNFDVASTTGYSQISNVAAGSDDHTVVVTFSTPFGDWKSLFGTIYPASKIGTPDAWINNYKNAIPVTAGPFKLDSLDASQKTITLVPDPNWWGAKPVLNKIVFRDIEVASQGDAFNNHEIDAFDIGPSAALYAKVKDTTDSTIHYAGGPNFRHITINTQSKLLSDVAVRKALFEAIDRDQIAQTDLKNLGTWQPKTLNNHFLVNNQTGYQDNVSDIAKFDPAQANKDLDAAGWVKGADGIRAKDGQKLVIHWVEPQGVKTTSNEAALVKKDLQAVGADINEDAVNSDDFFDKFINTGNFDMTAFSYIGTPFPISSGIDLVRSVTDQNNIHSNVRRDGNATLDGLLQTAAQDTDPTKGIADINAADKAVWQEFAFFTLYQRPNIVATKSELANYGAFGFADTDWTKVGFTG